MGLETNLKIKEKILEGRKIENRKEADGNSADGHRTDADIAVFGSNTPAFCRVFQLTPVFYKTILAEDFF